MRRPGSVIRNVESVLDQKLKLFPLLYDYSELSGPETCDGGIVSLVNLPEHQHYFEENFKVFGL